MDATDVVGCHRMRWRIEEVVKCCLLLSGLQWRGFGFWMGWDEMGEVAVEAVRKMTGDLTA